MCIVLLYVEMKAKMNISAIVSFEDIFEHFVSFIGYFKCYEVSQLNVSLIGEQLKQTAENCSSIKTTPFCFSCSDKLDVRK